MLSGDISNQILAVLFVAKEPVTLSQLQLIYPDHQREEIEDVVRHLSIDLENIQQAVEIREVAGGYRITTRAEHHEVIRSYLKTKPSAKLSLAALETLAVIAYKQPVTLPEVGEIRGVKATSTIRTLLEKRLIEMRGRKKVVGRPMVYGTTKEFLLHFGLKDLSELPTLEELEEVLLQSET